MDELLELAGDATFGRLSLEVDTETERPTGTIARVSLDPMMFLGRPTPDGRHFELAGFSHEDLPLPLLYKDRTTFNPGHEGARLAGSIREVALGDDGVVRGWGYLIDNEAGRDALLALKTQAVRGVSADLRECALDASLTESLGVRAAYSRSRLAGATIVPIPAFPQAAAHLDDDFALVASGSISYTMRPPRDAFSNPNLDGPTGIRVVPLTSEFCQVYGHLATWDQRHLSFPEGRAPKPPRDDDFAYFYSGGSVLCDDGTYVPVGRLFIGGDHPDVRLGAQQALDHYAATSVAWADVRVGRDRHGIWFAGVTRPGLSEALTYAARASAVSGDWRPIRGRKRLVAALSCNMPGFPVIEDGTHRDDFALVASGPPPVIDEPPAVVADLEPEPEAPEATEPPVVEEQAPRRPTIVRGDLLTPVRLHH